MRSLTWWDEQLGALARRGVSRSLIEKLWSAGDEKLVASLLHTPREQIARLNDLDARTGNGATMPDLWTDPITDNAEDTTRLNQVRELVKAHDEGRYTSLLHYAKAVKDAVDGPDTPQEDADG